MSKTNHSDLECKVPSDKNSHSGKPRRSRSGSARKSGDPAAVELRRQVSKLKQQNAKFRQQNTALNRANGALDRENAELKKRVAVLEHQFAELRRLHFGEKTDKVDGGADDSPDADVGAPSAEAIPAFEFRVADPAADGDGTPGGRLPNFPAHMEREERTIDPPERCPRCKSTECVLVDVDEMETHDVKPVAYYKLVTRRPKVKCSNCGKFRQAPSPKRLFPRGYLGDNLVADMVIDHVFMAMPINRQALRMVHAGLPDIRKSLNNYYHKLARELKPCRSR